MAKRKRRGLAGVATTPADLKQQAKACGSHYFDPDTMRFFNAKLIGVYPVPGKDKTYFVEAKGGSQRSFTEIPRHFTIGVFKGCRIESLGQGIGRGKEKGVYKTALMAKKIAHAIARKARR